MKRIGFLGVAVAGALLAIGTGWLLAVESVNIEQSSTEDHQDGTFEDVVVNNLGKVKLAHKLDALLKEDKDVAFVNALAVDDKGNLYAATAPNGKLFRILPTGECELWYTAKEKTLQSLAVGPQGQVYLGTGGGEGKIYRVVAKNLAEPVLEKDGLAYVWSMVVLADGKIVAGTGPNAEVILVNPDGKVSTGEVLYKPEKEKQKNILAVAADPSGKTIYFGTDTDGLVFKFDMAARKPFLLYDAEESEIACLALASDGSLYAGTSDPRGAEGEHSGDGPFGHSSVNGPDGPGMMEDSGGDDELEKDGDKEKAAPAAPGGKPTGAGVLKQIKSALSKIVTPSHGESAADADDAAPTAGAAAAGRPGAASQPDSKSGKGHTGKAPTVGKAATSRPESGHGSKDSSSGMSAIRSMMHGGSHGPSGHGGPSGESGGNAVYRIDPQGFVTEVLRQPSMMLALLLQGNKLIVGTGSSGGDGRVLAVTPGNDEIATLAKPKDVKQVLAMAPGRDGVIFIGTANEAMVGKVAAGYAAKGTFTCKPIDAKAVAHWGVISEKSDASAGGTVRVQTRSGNLAEPEDALWSAWSEPMSAGEAAPVAINSPPARFIQYRLVLTTDKPDVTPVVDSVSLSYIHDTQAPKITSAKAITPGSGGGGGGMENMGGGSGSSHSGGRSPMMEHSGPANSHGSSGSPRMPMPPPSRSSGPFRSHGGEEGEAGGGAVNIVWSATDPNDDTLEYTLSFRKAGSQVWVPLTEKPIRDENFQWSTRGLPDGQYQVKIVASNAPSNPPGSAKTDTRLTDVFTVDNTPPVINNFRVVETKDGKVTLAADVTDALSRLASGHVKVDQVADEGHVVLPVNGIWDQKTAALRFTVDLSDKPASGHVIILTVADVAGNLASASVEVPKP